MSHRKTWIRPFLACLLLACLFLPTGLIAEKASERNAFERLDPLELRAAERDLDVLVDRRTGQALREPANASEAYVIARHQRLVARLSSRPQMEQVDDGGLVQQFWPAARATRVSTGPDGRARVQCIAAPSLLNPALPDFRFSNQISRPEQ